jgi:uncharacterized repeat protein (TIGR03803 family)
MDAAGNLYGTTEFGGVFGDGTVFRYHLSGAYNVLTNFDSSHGSGPDGQLLRIADGSFLGTAEFGGLADGQGGSRGTIFKVTTNGLLTTVYYFGSVTNGNGRALDGQRPWSGLTLAADGNYYGTTYDGGEHGFGLVFGLTPNGTLTSVASFDGGDSGRPLGANLVQDSEGNLYGTTTIGGLGGCIFTLTPGDDVNVLYSFSGGTNGSYPQAGLARGLDGCFYGTTSQGGDYGAGTIFKITTDGLLTSLYSFDGANGAQPAATLVLGTDGNFYGTTLVGGSADNGVIFQFNTNGAYTVLHMFMGLADGANPDCGLTLGLDGNLYGVAEFGGMGGNGTLFELILRDPAPVLLSVERTNNTVTLTWSAVAGGNYQIQFSGDLSQQIWSNLGVPVTATTSVAAAIDPTAQAARRFYRVVMLP